jgi:TolB protein
MLMGNNSSYLQRWLPWVILGVALLCCGVALALNTKPIFNRVFKPQPTATSIFYTEPAPVGLTPVLATLEFQPTSPPGEPTGKIVYVCQLYKKPQRDQLCLVNADGSGFRILTNDPHSENFYPSLSPDGESIVFSSNRTGNFEIYEIDLQGNAKRLTNELGNLYAPEISPDGSLITFTLNDADSHSSVWVMNRDGSNPHKVYGSVQVEGWDPTWSPNGKQILFASNLNGTQLYTVNLDGSGLHQITHFDALRGRSDWSPDGNWIVTYDGTAWKRELFMLHPDGSELHQLTPRGGNSQGPSFSPDGKWVAFTAYFDDFTNVDGCEIYIIRTEGTDRRRLTANDYCDWQPRWGP